MKITKLGELYFMTGEVNRKYYETYGATINDCFKMLENKMGGGKLKQEKKNIFFSRASPQIFIHLSSVLCNFMQKSWRKTRNLKTKQEYILGGYRLSESTL